MRHMGKTTRRTVTHFLHLSRHFCQCIGPVLRDCIERTSRRVLFIASFTEALVFVGPIEYACRPANDKPFPVLTVKVCFFQPVLPWARMGVNAYSDEYGDGEGPYKSVAQIWQEATQQGARYRTLSAKHRYNVVKNCSGEDFIPESELKKVKSVGQGSFASGTRPYTSLRGFQRCNLLMPTAFDLCGACSRHLSV